MRFLRWCASAVVALVVMMPLSVTAAADPVQHPGDFAAVDPLTGVVPTSVVITRHHTKVSWRHRAILHGQVRAVVETPLGNAWQALEGAPVHLHARPAGGKWRHVQTRTSDWRGFRFSHRPWRNTTYRVVYRGNIVFQHSAAAQRVGVMPLVRKVSVWRGHDDWVMRGKLVPDVRHKLVRVQRRAGGHWRTVAADRTSLRSWWRVTGLQRGLYRLELPPSHGFVRTVTRTLRVPMR